MEKLKNLKWWKNNIHFISKTIWGDLKLAGNLYLPINFDSNKKYSTIVFTGPFNQVKEQMGAIYGKKMSKQGYIFLAFDHQGYGASEGAIRNYEYAPAKEQGIRDAISFLRMHSFVDRANVYGLGACAGAAHMAKVALTDKRLKKVAFVSGMLVNTMVQFVVNNKKKSDEILLQANEARQKYYETNELVQFDALGFDNPEATRDSKNWDQREGYDYYMTKRAWTETYSTYNPKTPEFFAEEVGGWSARAIARFITTPTLTIYGTKASTKMFSWLFHLAKKWPKSRIAIKWATHVDMYDRDEYVDQAIDAMVQYFK